MTFILKSNVTRNSIAIHYYYCINIQRNTYAEIKTFLVQSLITCVLGKTYPSSSIRGNEINKTIILICCSCMICAKNVSGHLNKCFSDIKMSCPDYRLIALLQKSSLVLMEMSVKPKIVHIDHCQLLSLHVPCVGHFRHFSAVFVQHLLKQPTINKH